MDQHDSKGGRAADLAAGRSVAAAMTEIDNDVVLAFSVGPIAVLCWRGRPTIPTLQATQEMIIAQFRGRELGMLSIIEASSPPPGTTEREYVVANMRRFGPGLRAVATVIEGEGFGAAAIRAVMSGLQFAMRLPYPVRTFAAIPEAGSWLQGQFPGAFSGPGAFAQAVSERRRARPGGR